MFPLVDRDGLTKPVLQIIAEEAIESGIEEICIVTSPGDEVQYRNHFRGLSNGLRESFKGKTWALQESDKLEELQQRITYVVQESPEGYGHAVHCARDFVDHEPFLLLLGDHVYISGTEKRCARQAVDVFERYGCSVSAVRQTPEDMLHLFGTVTGKRIADDPPSYEVTLMKEKPNLEYAESYLRTPGIRTGLYLCFFGMQVFTPTVFDCLEYHITHNVRERGEIQLTSAQDLLRSQERYIAFEANGERYDMGVPFGLAETQIALALNSPMRDRMLTSIVRIIGRGGQMVGDWM